jgi:hypothetical protein
MESACWWAAHRDFVIVSERPTVIHRELVDANRPRGFRSHRLHCDSGPAIAFQDGWGVWAWHGVRVDRRIIEAPWTITVPAIQQEANAEVRRIMLERFGLTRYLLDSGAAKIAEDEFGELYRTEIQGDEPLVMVKVMNSTSEPDGSHKPYFLRVHPDLRPLLRTGLGEPQKISALNATASTFGLTGKQYLEQLVEQS